MNPWDLGPNYLDLAVVHEVLDPTLTSSILWITIVCPQVGRFNYRNKVIK